MTVTTKTAAAKLIREADISSVWAYTNLAQGSMKGRTQYVAFTDEMYNDVYQAPNVCDPVCLKDEEGLTEAGESFMLCVGLDEIKNEDLYPISKEAKKFNEEKWND